MKKNVSKKINQLNFGRGKKFQYIYITDNKIRVFKTGIQLVVNQEEFNKYFEKII